MRSRQSLAGQNTICKVGTSNAVTVDQQVVELGLSDGVSTTVEEMGEAPSSQGTSVASLVEGGEAVLH